MIESVPEESAIQRRIPLKSLLIVLPVVLGVSSLISDSITFDETKHFASGLSYLKTFDFRLSPDTPPLSQMVLSLPSLFMEHEWPGLDAPGWRQGDVWPFGWHLLYEVNDGTKWILPARMMAVGLLVVVCLLIHYAARILFGEGAGCLALVTACLSPTLLSHGRLVTTDLAITATFLMSILAFDRLLKRLSLSRLLLLIGALSCAGLTKFSWPLVLPALAAMGLVTLVRPVPWALVFPGKRMTREIGSRWGKAGALAAVGAITAVGVVGAIWTCYGWQYSPYRGLDADDATMIAQASRGREAAADREFSWTMTMQDEKGQPLQGVTAGLVRWSRRHELLPEAYLFGLAFTLKTVQSQVAYLRGEVYEHGRAGYFPTAFLLKTPMAILALLLGALVSLALSGWPRWAHESLLAGLGVFVVVYLVVVLSSDVNLGHRHLLPIYPPLFILVGKAFDLYAYRIGRWFLGASVLFLAYANLSVFPNYLAYFNELAGGPAGGYRYLLDSNLDWGQDLKRLRDYLEANALDDVKLSYFGSADPVRYGVECAYLPSHLPMRGEAADLDGGTYIISLNQLFGLYIRQIRDDFWENPANRQAYAALTERFSSPETVSSDEQRREREYARSRFELARRWRLINQLRSRRVDDRVGWTMFVFHLTDEEIRAMTAPY
ncbi:MAG: hypothetical protein ACYTHJ_05420 [Planctomycetota bacterium]